MRDDHARHLRRHRRDPHRAGRGMVDVATVARRAGRSRNHSACGAPDAANRTKPRLRRECVAECDRGVGTRVGDRAQCLSDVLSCGRADRRGAGLRAAVPVRCDGIRVHRGDRPGGLHGNARDAGRGTYRPRAWGSRATPRPVAGVHGLLRGARCVTSPRWGRARSTRACGATFGSDDCAGTLTAHNRRAACIRGGRACQPRRLG